MNEDATAAKAERLYIKAITIRYQTHPRQIGLWLPVIRHLALRNHTDAMVELAAWYTMDGTLAELGSPAHSSTPAALYRRAYRAGNCNAAQHLARGCFNRNDLVGYRYWLRRAARAGDASSGVELRMFETRLPHEAARKIRRLRPLRRSSVY